MEFIRPDQFLTVFLFLGLLGLAWLAVKMNRGGLGAKLKQGKRITVEEVTALGPQDRAMILRVDGADYFVIKSKGVAAVVTPLAKGDAE